MGRQIVQCREPAEGLAEHRPGLDAQLLAQVLAIGDDLIGPHVAQVLRLVLRGTDGLAHRIGQPRAALVEEDQLVVLQSPGQPGRGGWIEAWPGGLMAGPALQEQQIGPAGAPG